MSGRKEGVKWVMGWLHIRWRNATAAKCTKNGLHMPGPKGEPFFSLPLTSGQKRAVRREIELLCLCTRPLSTTPTVFRPPYWNSHAQNNRFLDFTPIMSNQIAHSQATGKFNAKNKRLTLQWPHKMWPKIKKNSNQNNSQQAEINRGAFRDAVTLVYN